MATRGMQSLRTPPPARCVLDAGLGGRRGALLGGACVLLTPPRPAGAAAAAEAPAAPRTRFASTPEGLRYADLVEGKGAQPTAGCRVAVAFSGRLAAKNGWTFSTVTAEEPFEWVVGDPDVVPGLSIAVMGMRVGGARRLVVPPALGYRNEAMRPTPQEFWQRRRLFSTVFNPTRIANGEGDTLATTVWDLQLLRVVCS